MIWSKLKRYDGGSPNFFKINDYDYINEGAGSSTKFQNMLTINNLCKIQLLL
jgi:hypothetical protein